METIVIEDEEIFTPKTEMIDISGFMVNEKSSSSNEMYSPNKQEIYEIPSSPPEGETVTAECPSKADFGQAENKEERVRLSGAARKRLKYLMAKGVPKEKARIQCMKPCKDINLPEFGVKRSVQEYDDIPYKRPKWQTPNNSQRGPSNCPEGDINVGVLSSNFPTELLTVDQMNAVQESLLDKITELEKDAPVKPKFSSSDYRPGWLALVCPDKGTVEWLKNIISELTPWKGASLKVAEEEEMPYTQILTAHLPLKGNDEYSNEKILKLLEAQNEGLNATSWGVLNRETKDGSIELTLSADMKSVEILKSLDYKISYRFGQLQLKPNGDAKKPQHYATTSVEPRSDFNNEVFSREHTRSGVKYDTYHTNHQEQWNNSGGGGGGGGRSNWSKWKPRSGRGRGRGRGTRRGLSH